MTRPNVLWINTDQHTFRALSCASHPDVETPNIDRLADTGVMFTDAYCPSPVCGPSRAALFSGLYPRTNGFESNNGGFDEEQTVNVLPELLRDAGYDTALVGKLHLVPKEASHGFRFERLHDAMYDLYHESEPRTSAYVRWLADERFDGDIDAVIERANEDENAYLERDDLYDFLLGSNWRTEAEHSNTWVTEETVRYLREERREPFFLFSSYFGPHQPMRAPGRWEAMYDPEELTLPDEMDIDFDDKPIAQAKRETFGWASGFDEPRWTERRYREVLAAYYGQISMIDAGVGRILDAVDELGLRDSTAVVFTADHGDHAGQFGWFFKGTMYEHSVRIPLLVRGPNVASGERCEHVVNNLDLFQTILDRCGIDGPETASRSLDPLLDSPNRTDWVDQTYSELGDTAMVVDGSLKLVQSGAGDETRYELYDRTARPYDGQNLWNDPEFETERRRMTELLAETQRDLDSGREAQ